MGIRIHKAIGYGLELTEENRNLLIDNFEHNIYEIDFNIKNFFLEKYKDFADIASDKDVDVTVKEMCSEKIPFDISLFIHLLINRQEQDFKVAKDFEDCFSIVNPMDSKAIGILFYPPSDAKKWQRYDDEIDYYWALDREMQDIFEPISVKYNSVGIFPYEAYESLDEPKLKLEDLALISQIDNDVEPGFAQKLINEGKIRNYIPPTLREVLWKANIFKNSDDIFKLKPYKAEWWS